MTTLRDMKESDVEDYVRWFTTETEWGDWDAPWEGHFEGTPEEERKSWTEYLEAVRSLPPDAFRRKFEIELDGRHVGWICSYTDLGYLENPEGIPAIGLDIPDPADRGRGCGLLAFRLYTDQTGFHQPHPGHQLMPVGKDNLRRIAWCGSPDIRCQIAKSEIHFVTDAGDHRFPACGDCPGYCFIVKAPQILRRSASPGNNDHIRICFVRSPDPLGDLAARTGTLHRCGDHNDRDRRAAHG